MGKALAFISSLFGLEGEPAKSAIRPVNPDTLLRLEQLCRSHSFVEVSFPEQGGRSYQSLILDINAEQRCALIDELFPALTQPVLPGEPIEVVSQGKGLPMRFRSEILSLEIVDGVPACRIALPRKIHAKQRRHYFRMAIPEDIDVSLRLPLADGQMKLCKVNNLSSSGIQLKINRDVTRQLRSSHVLEGARLMLPDKEVIHCDLEVRSYEYRKLPSRHTLVGGRLRCVAQPAQRKLDKLLADLQRLSLKEAMTKTAGLP